MSAGRLELKVGLFVTVLLGLAAIMSIKFNETGFGLRKTYPLKLQTQNAGSIIPDSSVMMSGVKIGYVDKIDLQGDKGKVYIEVRLYPEYRDQVCHGSPCNTMQIQAFLLKIVGAQQLDAQVLILSGNKKSYVY